MGLITARIFHTELPRFVAESNRIEGIGQVTNKEILAHEDFLELDKITVSKLEALVSVLQPGAVLRKEKGMDVRVGNHRPPSGCPAMRGWLDDLLMSFYDDNPPKPVWTHKQYESLHPFTDGNGRSGRALWLWQTIQLTGKFPTLPFLHQWYYDSLGANR